MLLSALFVYFRDMQPIWEVLTQVLFYASPVIIPVTTVQEQLSPALLHMYMLNPLAVILQQFRHAMINPATPSGGGAAGLGGCDRWSRSGSCWWSSCSVLGVQSRRAARRRGPLGPGTTSVEGSTLRGRATPYMNSSSAVMREGAIRSRSRSRFLPHPTDGAKLGRRGGG